MSADLWRRLYDARAFKPTPSLWELAETHVPFAELGASSPPELPVRNALEEADGVGLLVGPPGGGKSSVLAHVASQLGASVTATDPPRRYLPIFVPVAAREDAARDLGAFGKGAILEVLLALKNRLPREARERLEGAAADQVIRQRTPSPFTAKLISGIPGLGAEVSTAFADDVTTIIGEERVDNQGGLKTLGDIAGLHGYELSILVEDTDAWASMPTGEELATEFLSSVLRPLTSDADVAIAVAVQERWSELDAFRGLAERAVATVSIPGPPSRPQAPSMIRAVLSRRARRAEISATELGDDPSDTLFTHSAIDVLAAELAQTGSFRVPLTRLRDTLDRFADDLPDRIDREHLLESF